MQGFCVAVGICALVGVIVGVATVASLQVAARNKSSIPMARSDGTDVGIASYRALCYHQGRYHRGQLMLRCFGMAGCGNSPPLERGQVHGCSKLRRFRGIGR